MADAIPFNETCVMCPRRGKHCKGCLDARYCSIDCQKLDLGIHTMFCGKQEEGNRPSKDHIKGLFFPGGKEPAKKVWISTTSEDGYLAFDHKAFLGDRSWGHQRVTHNTIQARNIGETTDDVLWFVHLAEFLADAPNTAMREFSRSRIASWRFRGPWFAFRCVEDEWGSIVSFVDLCDRDIRNIADTITVFGRNGDKDMLLEKTQLLACVIDHPPGPEDAEGAVPAVSEIARNACGAVFSCEGSGITNLIGIPLLFRQLGPHSCPNGKGSNPSAAIMLRDITSDTVTKLTVKKMRPLILNGMPIPIADRPGVAMQGEREDNAGRYGFATSPDSWYGSEVGTTLVSRVDGLPLTKPHLIAICGYIKEIVEPKLQQAIVGLKKGDHVSGREAILNSITKANFLEHYQGIKDVRAHFASEIVRWDVEHFPSPYELDHRNRQGRKHMITRSLGQYTTFLSHQQTKKGLKNDSEREGEERKFSYMAQQYAAGFSHGL